MTKIDFKKQLKHRYNASAKGVVMVDVPPMNYLMVEGKDAPNTSREAQEAIETLFPVAYAIKFRVKKEQGIDYGVMPRGSVGGR